MERICDALIQDGFINVLVKLYNLNYKISIVSHKQNIQLLRKV